MRSVVTPALFALLLAVAGAVLWLAGQADRRVADVHQQLATLQYEAAGRSGADVEQSLDLERRLPVVGPRAVADVHEAQTTARYWAADYSGIQPQHDATPAASDSDPTSLLLAANAAFRASQGSTDRTDTLRRLDGAIKTYSDALKASSQQFDLAYNFEYAVRVRDAIGRSKPGAAAKNANAAGKKTSNEPSDLPAGPTLHGRPGAPPSKTEMSQFKIVIPKRGEERKDNPEAGKGGTKIRKG